MQDEMLTLKQMALQQESNSDPDRYTRGAMEAKYGQVWTTDEMTKDFEVLDFGAPFVVVRRRSDGKKGSLQFCHQPRWYHSFVEA